MISFLRHPALSESFMKQLYKNPREIVVWATVVSALAVGLLVTIVMIWSGARTFSTGLRNGFIFGLLFLCSVDFGLLAASNNFTTAGAFADLICSTATITLSSGFCAWLIGKGKKEGRRQATGKVKVVEVV
jgi:hypothetical protein